MIRNTIGSANNKRELAKNLAAHGFSNEEVGVSVGVKSAQILKQRFGPAMEVGVIEANFKVAKTVFEMATSGKSASAAIFWLRSRAGWMGKAEDYAYSEDVEMVFAPYSESVA